MIEKIAYESGSIRHYYAAVETLAERASVLHVDNSGPWFTFYFKSKVRAQQFQKALAKNKYAYADGKPYKCHMVLVHRTSGNEVQSPWAVQVGQTYTGRGTREVLGDFS